MKIKKTPINRRYYLPEEKPFLSSKEIREIQQRIKSRRNDIRLLFAFASGTKAMPVRSNPTALLPTERTEADDKRMLFSLQQARAQIRCWEEELLLMEKKA